MRELIRIVLETRARFSHRNSNYSDSSNARDFARIRITLLIPLFLTMLWVTKAVAAEPDAILSELEKAKTAYAEGSEKARASLLEAFDEVEKAIAQTGDLDGVKTTRAERAAFAEKTTLPTSQRMRSANGDYQRTTKQLLATMDKAYEQAVKELTKALAIERADAIQKEWKEFQVKKSAMSAGTAKQTSSTEPRERLIGRFDIRADGDWQASVKVQKGDRLRLEAEGTWSVTGREVPRGTFGPDGLRPGGGTDRFGWCAILMARINSRNILVGRGTTIVADSDGTLQFRINDGLSNDGLIADNSDAILVAVYAAGGGALPVDPFIELKQSLSGSRWDWGDGILTFKPDGYVAHPVWDAVVVTKWEVVDRRTVALIIVGGRNVNRLAVLEFAEDVRSFTGRDFISGEQRLTPKKRVE